MPVRRWGEEAASLGPIPLWYGASAELVEVVYTVCKLLCPGVVVETGVGSERTTTAILTALDENGSGQLHSIELPSLYRGYAKHVAELVPESLRGRWSLTFGPSGTLLPGLLTQLGCIDVFVHDSAHNFQNQKVEYEVALNHLTPGGVLVSDDVNNDAFIEVSESGNYKWSIIRQSKTHPIGVLSKLPSATC